jgi:hypothetical protein
MEVITVLNPNKWIKVLQIFTSNPNRYDTTCYRLEDGNTVVQAQVLDSRDSP